VRPIVLRAVLAVAALAVVVALAIDVSRPAPAAAAPPDAAFYQRPAFPEDFADPAIIFWHGRYYAYATAGERWNAPGVFPMLVSKDLSRWRYYGSAMQERDLAGISRGNWWAPSPLVLPTNRTLLYFSMHDIAADRHCIAVATAPNPSGPFTYRNVITCGDGDRIGAIDAFPFRDADGRIYLYYSSDMPHGISVLELRPDGLGAVGPATEVLTPQEAWARGSAQTVEGPALIVDHGRYYLFYSGNDWRADYGMGVATSHHPLGPFEEAPGNPFLRGTRSLVGPGGGTVFRDPAGKPWLAYHAWTRGLSYERGGVRALRLIRLRLGGGEAHLVIPPRSRP
jgi:beta-xylosidase